MPGTTSGGEDTSPDITTGASNNPSATGAGGSEDTSGGTTDAADGTDGTAGQDSGTESTAGESSTGAMPECGNGILEEDEQCDGADLGIANCLGQDFVGGELGCAVDCTFDTSMCVNQICGNGVIEEDEACDGADLGGADCVSEGATAGQLGCAADCTLDLSGCETCGNDMIEGSEVCDGADLGGETCETLGLDPGELACAADCSDVVTVLCGGGDAAFILTERGADNIWAWDPSGMTSLFHSTTANDVDCNAAEGSNDAWVPEHFGDTFGYFAPGSVMGVTATFGTPYAYPKHITVFNNEIVVMSRNDATLHWYNTAGVEQGFLATGNGTGQGMATDGTDLWASFWNGANSFFVRYDASFVFQEMVANPVGLGANDNVVDFAYDPSSGNFYGIVTDSEGGTGTQSNTIVEFDMGGSVQATYNLAFFADGIGQQGCI